MSETKKTTPHELAFRNAESQLSITLNKYKRAAKVLQDALNDTTGLVGARMASPEGDASLYARLQEVNTMMMDVASLHGEIRALRESFFYNENLIELAKLTQGHE